MIKLSSLSDEDLALAAQLSNDAMEYLLEKFRHFAYYRTRPYFIAGADREDLLQEGMIGLFKAVRDFRKDKQTTFKVFAALCIKRQLITAIKTATRKKHIPLNSAASLDKPVADEELDRSLLDVIPSDDVSAQPEKQLLNCELSEDIKQRIQEGLSELEATVLLSYLQGESYRDMSDTMTRGIKSIDNALQRVRRKIEKNLTQRDWGL